MIYPEPALIAKLCHALAEIDADLERLTRVAGCGHCRRRTLPPSILFLGRKVYWGAVIVMIGVARQRHPGSNSACRLRAPFGGGGGWQTVKRWIHWFVSPCSGGWRRSRGRLSADLRDDDLPAGGTEPCANKFA